MNELSRITVRGSTPYDVVVGRGIQATVPEVVPPDAARVAVIRPGTLAGRADRITLALEATGRRVVTLEVPEAESAKTADVAARCWATLGQGGFTRSDAIVSIGGGATSDLAGFVAGTWLRGVPIVHVPTTLLGMVDAAVGGKTGINTVEGKNLVGVFHSPSAVLCDLDSLVTLPTADLVAGLAEVVKVGFTSDPVILDLVAKDPRSALDVGGSALPELVERAIRVKADVVSDDFRESRPGGLGREVLNYGHTFGHAIEKVEGYRWRHGDAVAVGMTYVAALAHLAGRLSAGEAARHRAVLDAIGLPSTYPAGRFPALLEAMRIDKKARGDQLRFVVLDGIGRPGLLEGPAMDLLEAAYAEVSERTS